MAVSPQLTVAICTRNPNGPRLDRVLTSLRTQTVSLKCWELLLVDNGSTPTLSEQVDLSWHPQGQITVEPRIGLSWARVCAARRARSELLVFVDDDNVLAADYLAQVILLEKKWPQIAAWGAEIVPEYEVAPSAELVPYLGLLALCEVPSDIWCNYRSAACLPRGAGLVVRRSIVHEFARRIEADRRRQMLGRQGENLNSGEDSDLCFTAIEMGHGVGLFRSLHVTHLIPRQRLSLAYLLRLQESIASSWTVLNYLHEGQVVIRGRHPIGRLADMIRLAARNPIERQFERAAHRGKVHARALLRQIAASEAERTQR